MQTTGLRSGLGARIFDQAEHAVSHRTIHYISLPLLEKDAHVHLAVHRRRGGEILAGLLELPAAAVKFA